MGAHVSVAGGAHLAFERAVGIGCETMQIFVKNANRWRQRPFHDHEVEAFREAQEAAEIAPVFAHASYLINLASDDEVLVEKSIAALGDELDRCELLGIDGLVLHPGSHLGRGVAAGLSSIAQGLDRVLDQRPGVRSRILLENTAGQGNTIGRTLEELEILRQSSVHRERVGICIDTCHAFVGGHAIHTAEGYEAFFSKLLEVFPVPVLACFHLNDSKGKFNSRLDRHENLGQGGIGVDLFSRMMHDPRLEAVPMIVETPGLDRLRSGHRADIALLEKFRRARV